MARGFGSQLELSPVPKLDMLSIKADLNPGLDTWDWERVWPKTDEANAAINNGSSVGYSDKERDGVQVASRKEPKMPSPEYTVQPKRKVDTHCMQTWRTSFSAIP